MPQPPITQICLKIIYSKFHWNFPGANELIFPPFSNDRCPRHCRICNGCPRNSQRANIPAWHSIISCYHYHYHLIPSQIIILAILQTFESQEGHRFDIKGCFVCKLWSWCLTLSSSLVSLYSWEGLSKHHVMWVVNQQVQFLTVHSTPILP